EDFGLQDFWETEPGKLSLGQKKLLVLAFCSAQDTPLYLLDEPTSALSGESILKVKKWLKNLLSNGKMVIMVDHNPDLGSLATQILDLGK
ncbi:MAG: ATP-binding cassette domain-containing protein, partial [Candidatus Syntrophosphaera sp.]|nr:ATP-binding cassette domain-containing protein [Candidatus Syntrophosphaera sp.]